MNYRLIYADPPWTYKDKASAGERGAAHKYTVMGLDAIKAMPIGQLCHPEGAVLAMWATEPLRREAYAVIDAWGFTFKTTAFVWRKMTKNGKEFFGMGNWTRSNAEAVLLAVRGKNYPRRINAGIRQMQDAEYIGHSAKPQKFRTLLEQLMGPIPRVELFAREKILGWDAWGNQCDSTPEVATLLDAHFKPELQKP